MKVKHWYQCLLILSPLVIALTLLLFSIFTEWWSHTNNLILDKNQKLIELNVQKTLVKNQHQIKFYKYSNLFSSCYDYKWINLLEPSSLNITSASTANCLNNCDKIPCFCCKQNPSCCIDATKMCDFKPDCFDESDELFATHDCNPIHTGFYKIKYYDKLSMCYREKYDYISYIKSLFEKNVSLNQSRSDETEFETFNFNLLSLFNLLLCAVFTIFSFISILFIKCCSYKTESTASVKAEYYDNYNKRSNLVGFNDKNQKTVDNDDEDEDDDSEYTTSGCSCFKCTYYLCPFIFFTIFALLAFLCCLTGLSVYIYSNFSIYKNIYFKNQLYHLNSWLFHLNSVGISFYTLCGSCIIYAITVILSIFVTCRIQLSPEWTSRYSETYEILQMHETLPAGSLNNKKQNKNKRIYKN